MGKLELLLNAGRCARWHNQSEDREYLLNASVLLGIYSMYEHQKTFKNVHNSTIVNRQKIE